MFFPCDIPNYRNIVRYAHNLAQLNYDQMCPSIVYIFSDTLVLDGLSINYNILGGFIVLINQTSSLSIGTNNQGATEQSTHIYTNYYDVSVMIYTSKLKEGEKTKTKRGKSRVDKLSE